MIYTITLNPSIDRTLVVEGFGVGGTFKAAHSSLLPAGKGINVARVAAALGERVAALGLVGRDDAPAFAAALDQAGVENRLTPIPGASRASVTILDPTRHTETHVREGGPEPPQWALDRVRADVQRAGAGDWVVLAGSLPPGLPAGTYSDLIRACADRGAYTVLDTSGPALLDAADARPTAIKPNLFELWQMDRGEADVTAEQRVSAVSIPDVLSAAHRVQTRGISMIVVSLGERGVLGLDGRGGAWLARVALDRPVVDTVGSGDALVGGWVVALSRGCPFQEALRLGVACGAANTLVAGAGLCQIGDVRRLAAAASVRTLT